MLLWALACEPGSSVKIEDSGAPPTEDQDSGGSTTDVAALDDDGDGQTELAGDCDDANPEAYTGAEEIWYDDVDQACDGGSDHDADGDASDAPGDCDDTDASVYPGAPDEPYDGVDTDCLPDDDDLDDDGWDWPDDCDDSDAAAHPDAEEVCGGGDEDCDGVVDGDSVSGSSADCAAISCLAVHGYRPDAPDGAYWIDLDGVATELVCDMTRDDGGWTLVANFAWPGTTAGVPGWTSGAAVGSTTTDRTQSYKIADDAINDLVRFRYRARGTATMCTQDDYSVSACAVDTTLYWASTCVYASGTASTGDCTAAFQTYDLDGWTELSNPCPWHYGLTSADCGVTSEFGTSHEGDHVFAGVVGTYIHAYDGRPGEDPYVEVWVR